jgi:hypothetical protein
MNHLMMRLAEIILGDPRDSSVVRAQHTRKRS